MLCPLITRCAARSGKSSRPTFRDGTCRRLLLQTDRSAPNAALIYRKERVVVDSVAGALPQKNNAAFNSPPFKQNSENRRLCECGAAVVSADSAAFCSFTEPRLCKKAAGSISSRKITRPRTDLAIGVIALICGLYLLFMAYTYMRADGIHPYRWAWLLVLNAINLTHLISFVRAHKREIVENRWDRERQI
ncbi:MAG: hypothetical protein JWL59_2368 [Chthoniobacteraceae bacterium]|nr:hypothetical protein [Chthoniobacteraceae bacterium]